MTNTDKASIGRRLSTWRRLVLLFAPSAAKKVAVAMSEFAWPAGDDPDAVLCVRHVTQAILCELCDYKNPRGLRLQLAKLERAGWIQRDDEQTGPKRHREYVLLIPESVPDAAKEELQDPSAGMWKRVLQAKSEGTGESEFPCSNGSPKPKQVYSDSEKSGSGELKNNIRGTEIPEQVNLNTPLKESSSSSLEDVLLGGAGKEPAPNNQEEKVDWKKHRVAARQRLNLNTGEST